MKAVVLETMGDTAAVLKEDGTIEKIKRICKVGEEILLEEKPKILQFPKKYMAIAASLALVIIVGSGGLVYASPTSYVTMDANLSFEFALNSFDEVVSMKALSKEGEQIASEFNEISPSHPSLNEAVSLTSELLYNANVLNNEKNNVIVSAVSNNDEKSIILSETAKTAFNEVSNKYGTASEIATAIGTPNSRNEAMSKGISTGQYIKDNANGKDGVYVDNKNSKKDQASLASTDATNSTTNSTETDASTPAGSEAASEGQVAPATPEQASTPAAIASDGNTTSTEKNAPEVVADDKNSSDIVADDKNSSDIVAGDKNAPKVTDDNCDEGIVAGDKNTPKVNKPEKAPKDSNKSENASDKEA
ncbi:MAG: hypothetical protein K5644_01165 [Lachnospiraceae bacterium]|nr:hypothetical protein [Lachnospiraceae bacterium]